MSELSPEQVAQYIMLDLASGETQPEPRLLHGPLAEGRPDHLVLRALYAIKHGIKFEDLVRQLAPDVIDDVIVPFAIFVGLSGDWGRGYMAIVRLQRMSVNPVPCWRARERLLLAQGNVDAADRMRVLRGGSVLRDPRGSDRSASRRVQLARSGGIRVVDGDSKAVTRF